MSIGSCWFFGFIIVIVLAACINPDLSSVTGSKFGQPMAQVSQPLCVSHTVNLPERPDILRCCRETWNPRFNVSTLHRPISHGPLHNRSCLSPSLGFLSRWRPPILPLFPPDLAEIRLYTPSYNLGMCFPSSHLRSTITHRTSCRASPLLASRRGQQSRLGNTNLRKGGVGTEEVQAGAFLHRGSIFSSDCLDGYYILSLWDAVVHVSS